MFADREHEDPHPPSSRRNPDGDPGRAAAAPGRGAARTRPGTIDRLVAGQSAPGADGSRGAGRVAARAGGAPSVLSRQPGLLRAAGVDRSVAKEDRKSVVWGKSVSGRVDLGG